MGRPRTRRGVEVIDVSKFRCGEACPRHWNRRIYAVDQDKNLWLCVPSAMPVPWRRDQVIEHDAAEYNQDQQVTHG